MYKSLKNTILYMQYYRKQILTVMMLIPLLLLFAYPFASDNTTLADGNKNLVKVFDKMDDIAGSGDSINTITDKLDVNFSSDSLIIGGYPITSLPSVFGLYSIVEGVAFSFLICSFCMSIGQLGYRIQSNVDTSSIIIMIAKPFIGLVFGLVFIMHAKDICFTVANLGSFLIEHINGADTGNASAALDAIKQEIATEANGTTGSGLIAKLLRSFNQFAVPLSYQIDLFIPYIATKIVHMIITFTCYGRAIELIILAVFSPFAFCTIVDLENIQQWSGIRYLKNVFALSISGAIILFSVLLCGNLSIQIIQATHTTMYEDLISLSYNLVAVGCTEAGLCLRAHSIARNICGLG